MTETSLPRLTAGLAAAFALSVLGVFPLYIDRFSNLGVVKYTGGFTLCLLFSLALASCAAVGGRTVPGRWQRARRDLTLWGLVGFAVTGVLSTVASLSPRASLWGLSGYYGGLTLVLYTAAAYAVLRSFFEVRDLDLLWLGTGVASTLVTVLYVLNIFNIDLIGAYNKTAVVERAQFFSTLGQKNFNGGFFAVVLPLVFYAFLSARGRVRSIVYGGPAILGTLALVVVDAEGLALGLGAAVLVLVCHRDFTTRTLRRMALLGAAFFGWAGWMYQMRRSVYTQGGTALLASLGAPAIAVTGAVLCLVLWAALRFALGGKETPLYKPARALTALLLGSSVVLVVLANLWPGFPSLGERLDGLLVFNDDWGTYRGTAWRIAWGTWADGSLWRKLVGVGPGMMHDAVAAWAGDGLTDRMATFYAAHNEYLEQLLTTGLLGLAAWLMFVISHLRRGFRQWDRPGVAPVLLALCSYLAEAVVSIRVSMIFPLVMVLFALLAALTAPELPRPAAVTRPGTRKKPAESETSSPVVHTAKVVATAVGGMVLSAVLSPILFGFLF